jgi:hypothetical protein
MLKATTRLACCEDILPPTSRSGGEVYAITQVLICTRQVSTTTIRCLEFRTRLQRCTEWLVQSPAHLSTTAEARQKSRPRGNPSFWAGLSSPAPCDGRGPTTAVHTQCEGYQSRRHQARNPAGTATPSSSRVGVDCERTGEVLKC